MKFKLKAATAIVLFLTSLSTLAATQEITATFSPSISDPTHNVFTNTTPQSGYCVSYPGQCSANGVFSVALGLTASLTAPGLVANAPPRETIYFKMPGAWREVIVTNENGASSALQFRFTALSAQYRTRTNWWTNANNIHHTAWQSSSFVNAPAPCIYSGVGAYSNNHYKFIWKWPNSDSACYKIPATDLTGEPHLINDISVGFELKNPTPLQMGSGLYTGSINLRVGPGGDIDFGDVYAPDDDMLTLNFSLTVNHELKLHTSTEDHSVALQACSEHKLCTEEEVRANWERWIVTNIAPHLTGRSHFKLSSSGPFTVYLSCEYELNNGCALKSEKSDQRVPVQSLLTLPGNIVSATSGTPVSRKLLSTQKDTASNTFMTQTFGQQQPGHIDFVINKRDVEAMLAIQPDEYSGMVTVLFDPNLY